MRNTALCFSKAIAKSKGLSQKHQNLRYDLVSQRAEQRVSP
ncbi:MAG: hypothetical protein V7K68_28615 [Nostoc sp.]